MTNEQAAMSTSCVDLAPAGVLDHKVTVYVAPNPLYLP